MKQYHIEMTEWAEDNIEVSHCVYPEYSDSDPLSLDEAIAFLEKERESLKGGR